jgi:ABC-2 type transport system ATP-binding protein
MSAVLEARDLVKRYGKLRAVGGVTLAVAEGTCFGLLGPNGAGKTTTVEILEGIHKPDSGTVLFRGQPISPRYRENIGIQFQATALPDHLKVREVLDLFERFYQRHTDRKRLVEKCALGDFLDQVANRLSGGQKQRLLLALALINDPEILFLDEPTTGLDPQARRNFWEVVQSLKAERKTILLTTHYMEEAHLLCDEIAIMDAGRIISHGTPDGLLRQHFDGMWIRMDRGSFDERILTDRTLVEAVRELPDVVEIQTKHAKEALKVLAGGEGPLTGLSVHSPTLEDLFLKLTGRALRG